MVEIKDMGKMPFNVFARLTEGNNEIISVHFGFDFGGSFLSKREHPEKYKIMESKIVDFASSIVKDWINSELKNEEKILNQLEKDQKDLEILVEGHTDTDKMKSKSHPVDNWELSVLRATSVVKIMLANSKMDPTTVSASGRSQFAPIDLDNKSKNRRIEVVLIPKLDELFEIINN